MPNIDMHVTPKISSEKKDPMESLDRYVRSWLAKKGSRSDRTEQTYLEAIRRSGEEVLNTRGQLLTSGFAAQLYADWLRRYSVNTANLMVAAWSALWEDLIADGELPAPNPWRSFRRRSPRDSRNERVLTKEEVKRLILNADPGMPRTLLRFLYATGCRISETVTLEWRQISLVEDGAHVATLYGKGGKTRAVRIRAKVWEELTKLPGYGNPHGRVFPVSRSQAWRWMQAAAERAGLAHRIVSPHVLRHSHATHALEAGANLVAVKENLGHARLDTTQVYLNLRPGPRSEAYLEDF